MTNQPKVNIALFAYAGIEPVTCDSLLRDLPHIPNSIYSRISKDALISRSRSRAATDFLRNDTDLDIMIMIDHDISWQPGDLLRLVHKVAETESMVGGVYSKRVFGRGIAAKPAGQGNRHVGSDELIPAEYLSAGFWGIHRKVFEKVSEILPLTTDNFWPFFMPMLSAPRSDGRPEYLSEDWAFCERARNLGFKLFLDLKPRLVHNGRYGFRVIDGHTQPATEQPVVRK